MPTLTEQQTALEHKEDAAEITKKTGVSDLEGFNMQTDATASAMHLKTAITLLPELRERKAVLDMHMNILTSIFNGIKNRQVDNFFQIEEEIMKQTKDQIMEVIKGEDKGNDPNDKLRLFIIWYLSAEQDLSSGEVESFNKALEAAGANVSSLPYMVQ